jgi:hypothetical protein
MMPKTQLSELTTMKTLQTNFLLPSGKHVRQEESTLYIGNKKIPGTKPGIILSTKVKCKGIQTVVRFY